MCTSIYLETKDSHHLLARTMDFHINLEVTPVYIPRKYSWTSAIDKANLNTKFGFIGTGRNFKETYFVADGINEMGLSISELYLPGESRYQAASLPNKLNLSPDEFILYILGNFTSIDELSQAIGNINLVKSALPELNIVTPLHWIITDRTGRCVVIEPLSATLTITENPVGVLSNSPDLSWHLQNLRNYLNVRQEQYPDLTLGTFKATPFSQGTGSQAIPGGFTPPERFVRAAFLKEYVDQADDEIGGIHSVLKILGSVSVPKGLVLNPQNLSDYSQYICTMCNESSSYYYQDYFSNVITKVILDDALLQNPNVKVFDSVTSLNIA